MCIWSSSEGSCCAQGEANGDNSFCFLIPAGAGREAHTQGRGSEIAVITQIAFKSSPKEIVIKINGAHKFPSPHRVLCLMKFYETLSVHSVRDKVCVCAFVCVCVSVCVLERERERAREGGREGGRKGKREK